MDVYWLEQTQADVPRENDWLGASEVVRLTSMRFAKRRADWRLGRWTAKHAVAAYLDLPWHWQTLADIEVRPALSGAPDAFVSNQAAAVTISLSHRAGRALCAVAPFQVALGCDLEVVEPRADIFVADYFTSEEQAVVAQSPVTERPQRIALTWSAKESALKALRVGLRLDTRSVIVSLDEAIDSGDDRSALCNQDSASMVGLPLQSKGWHPLHVRYTDQSFHGWWQQTGDLVRTLVGSPAPRPPIALKIGIRSHCPAL